jgi:hypothetical protein
MDDAYTRTVPQACARRGAGDATAATVKTGLGLATSDALAAAAAIGAVVTVAEKPTSSMEPSLVSSMKMPLPLEMTAPGNVLPLSDCSSGELVELPS